jgi:hypothetical protein
MTNNRVSPIGEQIESFDKYYDDTLNSISAVKVDIPDDNDRQSRKNPIIDNVKDSGLRKRRKSRSRSARRRRRQIADPGGADSDDDVIDDEDDIRSRIENKKGPGHWTPYLHERRSVRVKYSYM